MRILALKAEKIKQEEDINRLIREAVSDLSPVSMLKKSLQTLTGDYGTHTDLVKAGLDIGSNMIITKILGSNRILKSYIGAVLIQKVIAPMLSKGLAALLSGIGRMSHSQPDNKHIDRK